MQDLEQEITGMPSRGPDELQIKRNSEAFLNLASDIPEDAPIVQPQLHPNPRQPQPEPRPQPQAQLNNVEKSRVNTGLNIGPSYLDALSKLEVIDDTKAVEIQLPLSKKRVFMTSITGAEEQSLKTASSSPDSFLKKVNELVYYHTKFEDGSSPSFIDFLGELYPPDKATLIWGLLSATYITLPEVERTCDHCGERYVLKSAPNDLVHEDTFLKTWDKEMQPKDFTIKQEVFDGYITFEFGIPSEKERILITGMIHPETAKDNVTKDGDMMSQLEALTFFTRSIAVGNPGEETILTDLTQDIYPFLKNLSPRVADAVRTTIDLSEFNEYAPDFYVNSTCDKCGSSERVGMDLELTFFRKCLSI